MEESNPGPSDPNKNVRSRPRRTSKATKRMDMRGIGISRWTLKEMKLLLEGVQKFGVTRLKAINGLVTTRSTDQIKTYLWKVGKDFYKMNLKDNQLDLPINIQEQSVEPSVGVLTGTEYRYKNCNTVSKNMTAINKSLLLIENLEHHPLPEGPNEIDFKKLYNALYMAIKGYPLPDMNAATLKFFCDSFHKLLRAASAYPLRSPLPTLEEGSGCGSCPEESQAVPVRPLTRQLQAAENLLLSETLNPFSLIFEDLTTTIDIKDPTYDEAQKPIKGWLSKSDWNLV